MSDANINPKEKSQVTITGIIDGVYRARQQLIVSVIFILFRTNKKFIETKTKDENVYVCAESKLYSIYCSNSDGNSDKLNI